VVRRPESGQIQSPEGQIILYPEVNPGQIIVYPAKEIKRTGSWYIFLAWVGFGLSYLRQKLILHRMRVNLRKPGNKIP
jgi:hypothetical protein